MNKIGLIDVDGGDFPNLALMKISAHHKAKGDHVELVNGFLPYDRIYKSKVFDFSIDIDYAFQCDEIFRGGSGYDLENSLSDDIEHIYPDYSLYNIQDNAYGFLTRGCPRKCKFCIVSAKEGSRSIQVAELDEFWRGQRNIILLDPNITAAKECDRLFKDLADTGRYIEFNQGLDIRFLTDDQIYYLNMMKIKAIHFAWDNYELKTYEKLKRARPLLKYDHRRLIVYVLVNFNTTLDQDLERIYKLKELDYDPYVMIYDKPNAPKEVKRLQRWVNNRVIFKSCERFEEYRA